MKKRANSYAFCGGAFGDEGKGRIVDEYVMKLARKGMVVVYRDNGGANAGHVVTLTSGQRVAFHQLPSGVFCEKATVVLGKGMVLHPGDLLTEIAEVMAVKNDQQKAQILIDEMAVLSLDTHRAFESALKNYQEGSKGSTGRGIAPAYADVLLRHPLRMRDLRPFNKKKIAEHYQLYEALVAGLGSKLATANVVTLAEPGKMQVGSAQEFIQRLQKQAQQLEQYIFDVAPQLKRWWANPAVSFVFEKAQGIGLDSRWGVYPDVTASDTTFSGIFSSTESIVDHREIKIKAAVLKATYMSSVGSRVLPTLIPGKLAERIREDAHEYGATTRRPRDVAFIDLPALKFFCSVGEVTEVVLTHMDIVYIDTSIQVCTDYELAGKKVGYRPDQEFLTKVTPVYKTFAPWDSKKIQQAKNFAEMPAAAKKYLQFLSSELKVAIILVTTGPHRHQSIVIPRSI